MNARLGDPYSVVDVVDEVVGVVVAIQERSVAGHFALKRRPFLLVIFIGRPFLAFSGDGCGPVSP